MDEFIRISFVGRESCLRATELLIAGRINFTHKFEPDCGGEPSLHRILFLSSDMAKAKVALSALPFKIEFQSGRL